MNNTPNIELKPVAATAHPAPWSDEAIEDIRKSAEKPRWSKADLIRAQADVLVADALAHKAQAMGDAVGLNAAIMARNDAQGRMDEIERAGAGELLSMVAMAWKHRPDETSDLLGMFPPTPDVAELADAVAELRRAKA